MQNLEQLIGTIRPLDRAAMEAAARRQAQLAKPPGSLGRLEELSIQLAGITGQLHNDLAKKQLLVFAADNGVVAEGVASTPRSSPCSRRSTSPGARPAPRCWRPGSAAESLSAIWE